MITLIHFTTVHPRHDTRIRVKEVATIGLAFDADVKLFVQDGLGDEPNGSDHVTIKDTGPRPKGRLSRMTIGSWRMYQAVRKERPDIAHFHDPELIPVGMMLKVSGIKVIYDVHEDLPRQIMAKSYLPYILRQVLSVAASTVEWIAAKSMDQFILAGAVLSPRFPLEKSICVYNYPKRSEIEGSFDRPVKPSRNFIYLGGIGRTRGVQEMVQAASLLDDMGSRLVLGGNFSSIALQKEMEAESGWAHVNFLGWVSRNDLPELLASCAAGLVTLHPTDSYKRSYPTKLYEYMTAGLPVIASDFPFWRDILNDIDCAIYVNPLNPQEIADAMQWIIDNPEKARKMGEIGRAAVLEKFNWESEAKKLIDVYLKLMGSSLRLRHNTHR